MFAGSKTVSSERNDYIMKATGIVRRIDDLGRVVIPKEIRRTMRIREGTPLEIYTSVDGEVIFRKYSPCRRNFRYGGSVRRCIVQSRRDAYSYMRP